MCIRDSDYPQPNNIFLSYAARWLGYVSGVTSNSELMGEQKLWTDAYNKMYREHLPFFDLAKMAGIPNKVFERWVSHPDYDDYWKAMTPSPEQYAKMDIPILTITGYFDGDQPGAMNYYRKHMKYAAEEAKARHYLLFGPYNHGGTRHPAQKLGGFVFSQDSVIDMLELHKEWFDWVFKNGKKPEFLKDRVVYYMMGCNTWKSAGSLEKIADSIYSLYPSSAEGRAHDIFPVSYTHLRAPRPY